MKPKRTKLNTAFKIIHKYKYTLCYSNPTWLLKHRSSEIYIEYPEEVIMDAYFRNYRW